jgi:predicted MFS family arabinose efflux permease
VFVLFLARALVGLTAGNLPVAAAVISDTTEPHERAKGFGIIGAAFNFGFIFGPAISGITYPIWPALPFLIAAVISVIAVIATWLFLPETNKHIGQVHEGKLFDFTRLWHALRDPAVGATFLLTFIFSLALFMFFLGFQPFMVKVLHLSVNQIAALFTIFGIVGLISQIFIGKITKKFGVKRTLNVVFLLITLIFIAMYFTDAFVPFVILNVLLGLTNPTINPMLQTILSQETDPKMQGAMQGLNTSYMNLGQMLGPILGGAAATINLHMPFLAAAVFMFICFLLSFQVMKHKLHHNIS